MVSDRSLAVTADDAPLGFSGRARLSGEDALSLYPGLFTLELWNLPEEMILRLSRSRSLSVFHQDSCLVSGSVSDVFARPVPEGTVTSVSVSLGLNLWEAAASAAVPPGTCLSDAVREILSASGTGIPLLSFPEEDPALPRGFSYFGRAAEGIEEALGRIRARAMLAPSGLIAVSASGPPEAVSVTEADLNGAPAFVGGALYGTPKMMILSASVAGWRPGQLLDVKYQDVRARGLVTRRRVDADTGGGNWRCELMAEVM